MAYEETTEEDTELTSEDLDIEDDVADLDDGNLMASMRELDKGKAKNKQNHSLTVRRAIEDHLEETRLRKELDYLFDEN